jgi:hypothetical protein
MCVTSNFDLEVIQGRQFAVERILLLIKNCITVRLGPGAQPASRGTPGACGAVRAGRTPSEDRGLKLKGTDRIIYI